MKHKIIWCFQWLILEGLNLKVPQGTILRLLMFLFINGIGDKIDSSIKQYLQMAACFSINIISRRHYLAPERFGYPLGMVWLLADAIYNARKCYNEIPSRQKLPLKVFQGKRAMVHDRPLAPQ